MIVDINYAQAKDLVRKLKEKGLIEKQDMISRSGITFHFDMVLNYEKCNQDKWNEQKAKFFQEDKDKGIDVEGDNWEQRIEQEKYYPFSIVDEDTIRWQSRWKPNPDFLDYISLALPDEIIAYEAHYCGRFDCGTFYKNGEYVLEDGQKIFATIPHIKESMIKDVWDRPGSYQISLPYAEPDSDTSRFVRIYVKENQIIHASESFVKFDNDLVMYPSKEYKEICITSKNVTIYETGRKEQISAKQLYDGVERARSIYSYEKMHANDPDHVPYSKRYDDKWVTAEDLVDELDENENEEDINLYM